MFKPVSRAGTPIITPPLRTEDSAYEVAQANAVALNSAAMTAGRYNGIVQLPVGKTFIGNIASLDERHAGIVIRGSGPGKTVLIPIDSIGFNFISRLVDGRSSGNITATNVVQVTNASDYAEGEVIYFWNVQSGPNRSPRIRLAITNVNLTNGNVTHSGSSDGFSDFMHVKGFAVDGADGPDEPIPIGATSVRVPVPFLPKLAFFAPGDDVLLGDGPGINEFRGEWLTVADVNTDTGDVTFTTPTVQEYEANKAALVPGYQPFTAGGRQHMSDITLQDVSIAAPFSSETQPLGLIRAGLRFTFDNVGYRPNPAAFPAPLSDLQFVTCGRTSFRDVALNDGRLVVGTSQNANFANVTASAVHVREYARDCVFTACRTTGPGGFTIGPLECRHIDLTNCTISGYDSTGGVANVAFANDSAVTGLRLRPPRAPDPPDPVVITAQRLRLTSLASGSPVTLAAGSSGELLSPLDAEQLGDNSGLWDQPLTVRRDGVVRVPTFVLLSAAGPDLVVLAAAQNRPGLQVRGQPLQTEDLMQWQDSLGSPLFAVRADGSLASSKSALATAVGSIVRKLQLFDVDGTELGYIAIYDTL